LGGGRKHQYRCGWEDWRKFTYNHLNMQRHMWMCWMKYHIHIHIKGI
jgi:hypothetical protein